MLGTEFYVHEDGPILNRRNISYHFMSQKISTQIQTLKIAGMVKNLGLFGPV